MTLSPGTRLGPYEFASLLGEGGMGRVYRARDTQLERDVAIKILPEEFSTHPERLMRFEREARALAALNHPHIAQVYGLEPMGTSRALVMELVDGEDLAHRLARAPLPVDEAIAIARQIADALESAHDAGIVHRDLKPANVTLTHDGRAKVLDFGLATSLEPARAGADAMTAAVTSPAMTMAGMILGTAAYMSPEQARGKSVDRRADLWAFGCVLYEMLTRTRAFDGETITDVLSAVVSKEPDWSKLPTGTPPPVIRLLQRCLRKDPRIRLQAAGDARIELDEAMSAVPDAARPPAKAAPWRVALIGATAGAAIAVIALTLWKPAASRAADPPPPVMRYSITMPVTFTTVEMPALSPDGRWIAISALGPTGRADLGESNFTLGLWLRPMGGQAFQLIAGSELAVSPAWSPDSREIAFFANGSLFRIPVTGGTATRIAEVPNPGGAPPAWGPDGMILVSSGAQIFRVPASGGTLTAVTTADAANRSRAMGAWLPGDRLMYTEVGNAFAAASGIAGLMMRPLAGGTATRLIDGRAVARYTPQGLLAARMTVTGATISTISAHRFDPDLGTVEQPGVVLATDAQPLFGVSNNGVLVYRSAAAARDHRLEWVTAKGDALGDGVDVIGTGAFSLSRDERLVAFQDANDIRLRDLERGVTTGLVQGPGVIEPIISPDGGRVVYSRISGTNTGIAIRPTAGGAETMLLTLPNLTIVEDWSSDGRALLAIQSDGQRNPNRLVMIPFAGDHTPALVAEFPGGTIDEPRFSPDGKWVVYNASEGNRHQVYLAPLPATGERWQLSTDGGVQGRWRADSGAVFYLSRSGKLMEVTVAGGPPPRIGRPRELFDTGLDIVGNLDQYTPSADGTRFLLRRPRGAATGVDLHVIVNWPSLLANGQATP